MGILKTKELAIDGGTPVLERRDYHNWPIITPDHRRLINAVLESGILAGGTAPHCCGRAWQAGRGRSRAGRRNSKIPCRAP